MQHHKDKQQEEDWGAAEHALIGGLVGGAGVGNSIGLIGLTTGLAALPISIVIGVVGGLAWWAVRAISKKS